MGFSPIYTPRLMLRVPERSDLPLLCRLMNDREIAEDYGQIRYPSSALLVKRWAGFGTQGRAGGVTLPYAITLRSNHRVIVGGAHIHVNASRSWPRIGYWIAKPYRRKRFATEVARALIATLFEQTRIDTICGTCILSNIASQRVLKAAGMRRKRMIWLKTVERDRFVRGVAYEIDRAAWERSRHGG